MSSDPTDIGQPIPEVDMSDAGVTYGHEGGCRYCGILPAQDLPRPSYQELRAERDDLIAEIRDAYSYLTQFVSYSADPGTGTLAWVYRNRKYADA